MTEISKFCPKMFMPEKFLKYILATVQWCVARRGGVHDPKMYRPFTFPCNFFQSPSKKCLIRPANLIWLVGSYSLTHSLIWPTTDLLIDMHFFFIFGPSIRSHSIFRFRVGHSNNSHHSKSRLLFFKILPFLLAKIPHCSFIDCLDFSTLLIYSSYIP